jgi:hypothetical protein
MLEFFPGRAILHGVDHRRLPLQRPSRLRQVPFARYTSQFHLSILRWVRAYQAGAPGTRLSIKICRQSPREVTHGTARNRSRT